MSEAVKQAALDRAIDDKESLVLFYQPIHTIDGSRIIAAEALLRQRRESGEIREAGVISEAAEEAPRALLFEIDSWTTGMAYRAAASWQSNGAPEVHLNVNLSPREFQEGNVIPRLTQLITGCGVDPRRINLEITETSYIDKPEETVDIVRELKKTGINIWLDDFGTGHSSLAHLHRFPIDGLKIPKPYVDDVLSDIKSAAIVRTLISLAHELGIEVIAEGVEKREQLEFLAGAGCDYIQGFLFNKPMSLDDFRGLLRGQEGRADG